MPIDGNEKGNKVNTKKGAVLFSFLFFQARGGVGGFIVSKTTKIITIPNFMHVDQTTPTVGQNIVLLHPQQHFAEFISQQVQCSIT